ncbi:MAG TPA: extradiol ring-cleavage dioxygenase [Candidatus Dormibacteraeota bacterium]
MGLVFAAIAPHGGLAIEEACAPAERQLAAATRAGMIELGRLFDEARPQAVIVATPHNVHLPASMGVIVSGHVAGQLAGAPPSIALDVPTEMTLAWLVLQAMAKGGVPASGVSFGGNDPAEAVAPMDWGVLIPLWFMGGRAEPPIPLVVITPSRDLSAEDHVNAGAAVAAAAAKSGLRVAFIASADHGHAHDPQGPYGFDPAAKRYDDLICELVRKERLDRLANIPPELVESAKADSWWQMMILHGAIAEGWNGRLVSYEAPTYFGMLTAAYVPEANPGTASQPRKRSALRTRGR